MADFEVRGEDVRNLVRRIRTHGDAKAIRREMYRALNRATKPVRADMKASVPASLPSRGGLADLIYRRTQLGTSIYAGRDPGVVIRANGKGRRSVTRLNAGRLRHPVYGNRKVWVDQTAGVNPGFLDEAFQNDRPVARREVIDAMRQIARKVEG